MLESGLSLPDRMLDQVADFRRAERFLPAFTLSANQPGLFRLERFRAKWMPARAMTTRQIEIIEATLLIRVKDEKSSGWRPVEAAVGQVSPRHPIPLQRRRGYSSSPRAGRVPSQSRPGSCRPVIAPAEA